MVTRDMGGGTDMETPLCDGDMGSGDMPPLHHGDMQHRVPYHGV